MYIPVGINTILGSDRYKLSKTLLTIIMKSISPTEWMLSTQMKRSEGTGAGNGRQWQAANQQLTNNTDHVSQNMTPWAQVPEACERTFSTYYFLSQ